MHVSTHLGKPLCMTPVRCSPRPVATDTDVPRSYSAPATLASPASFSQLLRQLEAQHDREVKSLQETICYLRQNMGEQPKQPLLAIECTEMTGTTASASSCVGMRVLAAGGDPDMEPDAELLEDGAAFTFVDEGCVGPTIPEENADLGLPTQTEKVDIKQEASQLSQVDEKRSAGNFAKKVESPNKTAVGFEAITGMCIVVNIIFIFLGLEYEGYKTSVALGLSTAGEWPNLDLFLTVMEYVFCVIFLLELVVRLYSQRMRYFYNAQIEWLNVMDCIIVVFSVCDLFIIRFLNAPETNLTLLRGLRFFRMVRIARVFRTFEFFAKLRILMGTIVASFLALVWSMVLLFITMLMFSMIMCQLVQPYFTDAAIDGDTISWMNEHYGTAGRSLWTVFELTFSGGWPNYVRTLVEHVSSIFAYVFAVYISLVVFAMTRIITALFLKDTLQVAANDAEMVIQEKMNEKKNYAKKLMDVFQGADHTGDGKITLHEFETFLAEPRVQSYLATLELDTHETKTLFGMLDDGDGEVTAEEFVQGAMRLKGTARSQDVVSIMHDFNAVRKIVEELRDHFMGARSRPAR